MGNPNEKILERKCWNLKIKLTAITILKHTMLRVTILDQSGNPRVCYEPESHSHIWYGEFALSNTVWVLRIWKTH